VSQTNLETGRLIIRPFLPEDLPAIHRILDQTFGAGDKTDDKAALEDRRSWLQWSRLNQEWFPKLHQPPYGDRAVTLKASGELIGSVGFVPLLDVFDQIPGLADAHMTGYTTPEFGLFWVIDIRHQRQGYATEAARAMLEHAFKELRLKRVLATTEYTNTASQSVMKKIGMRIARNPFPDPPWLQIVGIALNRSLG
jgi:ribosomal-protein-alanine N-acetyltransferase